MSTVVAVYPGHKVLAMFPFYNEGEKLEVLVSKIVPGLVDEFVAVNDGSTDDGPARLRLHGLTVLDQERSGIGAFILLCVRIAIERSFDTLVVMSGNGKEYPVEIHHSLSLIYYYMTYTV